MKAPRNADHRLTVAYLAPELGSLTSTFIYREVAALRERGLSIVLFSTDRPSDACTSEDAKPVIEETQYLYDASHFTRVACALGFVMRRPLRSARVLGVLVRDAVLARTPKPSDRVKMAWHFVTGCLLARKLEAQDVQHLHAHFAHVPAAVAMYAALLAGISFSFTAHANDLFERGTALREKVGRSAFTAVISEYNRRFLEAQGCNPERIHVVRCGLDTWRYAFRGESPANAPPLLFSVGRFVEKKGFHVLIEALALLRQRNVPFRCLIAGGGPLYETVRAQAEAAGLKDCLEMPGAMPQEHVKETFERAGVFVLPCVVAKSGDRDGIPVALMEAMALGVPVISTNVSGIPELIADGENGLLVPENDSKALANALERSIEDAVLRNTLARRARKTIEEDFNLETIAADLESLFRTASATGGSIGAEACPI